MITQDGKYWVESPRLYYQSWVPEQVDHVVVISHGLGEHGGRYEHFARYLAAHRVAVYACDHVGHGRSSGQRGHVKVFGDYARFLREFIRFVCHKQKVSQVHLLGHSLGALIVHDIIESSVEQIDKVLLSNPAYKKLEPLTPKQEWLVTRLMNALPRLSVHNEIDPDELSNDSSVVHAYVADPLVHKRITLNFFKEFSEKTKLLQNSLLADVDNPILFLVAPEDPVCDQELTLSLYDRVLARNKSLHEYENMRHEPLNEIGRDKVYIDILDFILKE